MIVFKAECGHTVRAKDEDAGGVVRCSYCGRNAKVPETDEANLDFLLGEIEQTGTPVEERKRRRRLFPRRQAVRDLRKERSFDPFSIILRLCYFALLLTIVIVVARKFVIPMFDAEERARRLGAAGVAATKPSGEPATTTQHARREGRGLITESSLSGLYVSSTPKGAEVYVVEESKAPASGRINRPAPSSALRTDGIISGIADGKYVVEVAFPWNDPSLSDPSLSNHQDYMNFRRSIERASDVQRRQLVDDYFIPDEASDAFVAETDERIYFIRQYRGVSVLQHQSKGVRSLFLPRLGRREGRPFSIEPLVVSHIPDVRAYAFDEAHARNELNYYGVAETDMRFLIEALTRIGVIPYTTPDRRLRMFKIDIHDGAFTTRVLREALP
ncbi:MAG: hypothetical protein Q7R41_07480 [Phycisphaerales bacterium]|nr:hypothetical protein [Phycisphaerales bacterium]